MANILLAITGLSPQVVTETLYAMHQESICVDEIHIVTTRVGRDCINNRLLAPVDGKYHRYLAEYGIAPNAISFLENNIHVLRDEKGNPIDDITSSEENEMLLKYCLSLAHRFTRKKHDTVFFSIAGGRKTMSACLMTAAQLYGRPQDRIYHVLVSPEFERHDDFYYPPAKPVLLELLDSHGQKIFKETSYAAVTLVPIPFISLRNSIEVKGTGRIRTPVQLFRYLIKEKSQPLIIDLRAGKIIFKKKALVMMPSRLALYAFLIQQKMKCAVMRNSCHGCADCYLDFRQISEGQQIITGFYKKLGGVTEDKGICALDKESLRTYVSKIRQDIQKTFGMTAASQLSVESSGKKPDTRYGIPMDRERIQIVI